MRCPNIRIARVLFSGTSCTEKIIERIEYWMMRVNFGVHPLFAPESDLFLGFPSDQGLCFLL